MAQRFAPEGRAGDRRILGQHGPRPGGPDQIDAAGHFPGILARKAAEQVDADFPGTVSRLPQVRDGPPQILRRHLSPGGLLPLGRGRLEAQADRAESGAEHERGEPGRDLPRVQDVGTVKPAREPPPQDLLEHGDGSPGRIDEQGIVIEGEIDDAAASVPVFDLVDDPDGVPRSEGASKQRRGAVGASKGTSPRRQDGHRVESVREIEGGIGIAVGISGIDVECDGDAGNLAQGTGQGRFPGA